MNKLTRSDLVAFVDSVKSLRVTLDDKQASTSPAIFPKMKFDGSLIPVGTRMNFDGVIMRSRVDLWDTVENSPENAPTLWEALQYKSGLRVINGPITAENPVALGEQCWFNDTLYESTIANNVWLPTDYPTGWKVVE